jgi:hypothetical protein
LRGVTPPAQATATTPRHIALKDDGGLVCRWPFRLHAGKGTRSFTHAASDGQASSPTATATLHLRTNPAPVARDDLATTLKGRGISIDVLGNDSRIKGEAISVNLSGTPAHGNVVVTANGAIVYTPDAGFAGTDTFRYQLTDTLGSRSQTATVTVQVLAALPDRYRFTANTGNKQVLEIEADQGVRANDLPDRVKGRSVSLVSGPVRTAGSGRTVIALNLDGSGAFKLTLTAPGSVNGPTQRRSAKRGSYEFTYTLSLNGLTTPATRVVLEVE